MPGKQVAKEKFNCIGLNAILIQWPLRVDIVKYREISTYLLSLISSRHYLENQTLIFSLFLSLAVGITHGPLATWDFKFWHFNRIG